LTTFKFGIIANTGKESVKDVLPGFLRWLDSEGISFILASDFSKLMDITKWKSAPPLEIADHCEFVLSFGGDGTFLQTARVVAPRETPIIGINLGGFGYLAEVAPEQMKTAVKQVLKGEYSLEERMMLGVRHEKAAPEDQCYCLNDVVIDRGSVTRTIKLETCISGRYLNTFHADGLIISTPTGSTGYSLSTGGPILEPNLDSMVVCPICPHMLANRPLVVAGDKIIEVKTFSHEGAYQVSVDGRSVLKPSSCEKVIIQKAPFVTRLVVFLDRDFYAVLRNKLHWRDQMM